MKKVNLSTNGIFFGFSKEEFGNLKENKSYLNMDNVNTELKKYFKDKVLNSHKAQLMDGLGNYVIVKLFKAYADNPQQLPDKTMNKLLENYCNALEIKKPSFKMGETRVCINVFHEKRTSYTVNGELKLAFDENLYINVLFRTICNYISCMTDNYAIDQQKKLYNLI